MTAQISQWQDLAAHHDSPGPPEPPAELLLELPDHVQEQLHTGTRPIAVLPEAIFKALTICFQQNLHQERMALLLGTAYTLPDPEKRLLLIVEEILPIEATQATKVHVTMTPQSWPELWAILAHRTDITILGWAHSHPGHGAFFSAEDRRTQALWFSQPWHIGIVVDPSTGATAAFAGPEAEPAAFSIF
jgi:proteasome lid subunit RPN8/RPN11